MIASCGFLEDELRQCSKEEGVTMADSAETLGVDLRTEKETVQSEILAHQEEQGLSKEQHGGGEKLSRAGMMPARTWGVHAVEMASTERLKLRRQMVATAGKKEYDLLS